jgi:hypothetical protein
LFPFPALFWEALEASKGLSASANVIERVTKATSEDAARWAFTQWQLREKAKKKFELAEQMLFDRDGLEMASHERIASFHASLFDQNKTTVDGCCGIGSDLIALASSGDAVGFELDPQRADIAEWNLSVSGARADIRKENSLDFIGEFDQVFSDPSRRQAGSRLTEAAHFAPNPFEIVARAKPSAKVVLKLSPMLPNETLLALGETVLLVSFGRECREALCLRGFDRQPGIQALHLESGEVLAGETAPPVTDQPLKYIFDVDPAAMRANATGSLCATHGLMALGYAGGYLTGEREVDSPWLAPFEFIASYPFSPSRPLKLIQELPAAAYDYLAVKSRVPGLDTSQLTKLLRKRGKKAAEKVVVMLYVTGKSGRALVCRPTK